MSLNENRADEGADGSVRKVHYGAGEQPWDIIKRLGWAPEFAASNVLKYLRRSKHPEHSLESARWYYDRLKELMGSGTATSIKAGAAPLPGATIIRAAEVYKALMKELTDAEVMLLRAA